MSVKGSKLCLNDLIAFSNKDILAIEPAEALQICCAEANRSSDILRVWSRKLLNAHDVSNISTAIWTKLTALLHKIYEQLSKDVDANYFFDWLNECCYLLQTAGKSLHSCNAAILIHFALQTVVGFLQYYRCRQQTAPKNQLDLAMKLHNSALQLLNAELENFELEDAELRELCIKTFKLLCIVGEQKSSVDVKTIVETWKCVARLVTNSVNIKELRDLAKLPLQFLLSEIGRNVELMYNQDIHKRPIETIERYFRVTNFYLKLIARMAIDFQHQQFPAIQEFFSTYCIILRLPQSLVNTSVFKILETHVIQHIKELLALIFKHTQFNELLVAKLDNLSYVVAEDYVSVCLAAGDIEFIRQQTDLLKKLFEKVFKDVTIFFNYCKYTLMLEYFSAIAHVNPVFGNYLRHNVLCGKNLLLLHASTEIFIIMAFNLKTQNLLQEVQFWWKCNERFVVFSSQLNAVYVKLLLQHFYCVCSSNSKIPLNGLTLPAFNETLTMPSYRTLLALVAVKPNNTFPTKHVEHVLMQWLLNKSRTALNERQYYTMALNMHLLAKLNCDITQEMLHKAINFLAHLCFRPRNLGVMEDAVLVLLTNCVNKIKVIDLEKLLENLVENVPLKKTPTLALMNFITACSQVCASEVQQKSQIIMQQCTKIRWCNYRLKTAQANKKFDKVEYEKVIEKILPQANLSLRPHHCKKRKEICIESPVHKRPRLSVIETNLDNFTDILHDMLEKSQGILNTKEKLKTNEAQMARQVILNLQQVLRRR